MSKLFSIGLIAAAMSFGVAQSANAGERYCGDYGWYYYQYTPGYYYTYAAPVNQVPTVAAPAAKAPAATAANANSGAYRSFSADPGANVTYQYYYPGTYNYPSSNSGRSWGSRH
jgi:hypothetical protein